MLLRVTGLSSPVFQVLITLNSFMEMMDLYQLLVLVLLLKLEPPLSIVKRLAEMTISAAEIEPCEFIKL
jgi:hypothetical protein